jgi:hypothetical protein
MRPGGWASFWTILAAIAGMVGAAPQVTNLHSGAMPQSITSMAGIEGARDDRGSITLRIWAGSDPKLPGPDALLCATIASCTECTFEQHDFDGCSTP